MNTAGALAACFVIGSIPFGLLISRAFNVNDLTRQGSGNIGATNVSRVVGFWPAGFATLLLDAMKGAGPLMLIQARSAAFQLENVPQVLWGSALFLVLGHCFSPWLGFKGGKGVATAFGAILVLSPWAALSGAGAFVLAFMLKRIGSLASLSGVIVASVTHLILNPLGSHLWLGLLIVLLIVIRHERNIDALLENTERGFG